MITVSLPDRMRSPLWWGLGLLGLGAALLVACSRSPCPTTCEPGFVCDRNAGTCRPERLEAYDAPPPARSLELAVTDGRTYVAALDPERDAVLVGRFRSGAPTLRVLTTLDDVSATGLALAARDGVAVVAWRNDRGDYRTAERIGDRWRLRPAIQLVDQNYRATRDFDLAISEGGERHLVFYNRSTRGLHRLARPANGTWQLEPIDQGEQVAHRRCSSETSDGVGRDPHLAWVDDELFVAYYDARCRDLHLARHDGDEWRVVLADEGNPIASNERSSRSIVRDVGRFVSIASDGQGRVAMAYFDAARGRLRFARQTESGFDVQLVDPGLSLGSLSQRRKRLVGSHVDLAFDGETPRILYLDGTSVQLRYATRARSGESGRWVHRALDPRPPVGFHANLVFRDDGPPVAAAERLRPADGGLTSRLVTVGEEAL